MSIFNAHDIGLFFKSLNPFGDHKKAQDQFLVDYANNPPMDTGFSNWINNMNEILNPVGPISSVTWNTLFPSPPRDFFTPNALQTFKDNQKSFVTYQKLHNQNVFDNQTKQALTPQSTHVTSGWVKWGIIGLIVLLLIR